MIAWSKLDTIWQSFNCHRIPDSSMQTLCWKTTNTKGSKEQTHGFREMTSEIYNKLISQLSNY